MVDTVVRPPEGGENFVALPRGTQVGRYTLTGVLGQGTFGVTYSAHDAQLNRAVAIKEYLPTTFAVRTEGYEVRPNSTETAENFAWGLQRFVDEGRTLAGFRQAPGIVRVYDFLEANGTAYMVMELVEGDTLGARLRRRGRMSAAEIERILRPLLDGLEKIHAASFVHRDIKPDNILLDRDGQPTLIDFGAARAAIAGRTSALTGIFTPGYAAIEQFTDNRQGPWTDIYGLSATLYHAITGGKAPSAVDRTLRDAYVPLARLKPKGFPPALLAGIDRGLAVRPNMRPQTIADWRAMLFPTAARALAARWRNPALATAAALVVVAMAGSAWLALAPRDTKVAEKPVREPQGRRAEPAAQRQADADAQQRAAAQEALRRAEEDAVRRDAERQRAEQQAREKADAERALAEEQARKARDDIAKAQAEAERAARAAETAKATEAAKSAEATEAALHLGSTERQRLQLALTAQGFDTRGSDGVLGPRSREMIAAWQGARGLPATGYLDGGQQQRLLRESAAALQKYDDERKKAAEDEARRREQAVTAPGSTVPNNTAAVAPPPPPAASFDGRWTFVRAKCIPAAPQRPLGLTVQGNRVSYSFTYANHEAGCSAQIRPDGSFANSACEAPISGRITGNRMALSQKHPEIFCDFEFQRP